MKPLLDVMADKVVLVDDCWEWVGYRNEWGYGIVRRGTLKKAHREVYELLVGPVPDGMELDHLCRNKACVRPDHLEAVDHRTNVRRGNAPTAENARKTHCVHGHEFTKENTIIHGDGRECRTCKQEWNRRNNWRYR